MIKKCYLFLNSFFLVCLLAACSSKPSVVAPSQNTVARSALFSNAILFPSDAIARVYVPTTKSLVSDIRTVGGEVYQAGDFVTIIIPNDALFEPATSVLLSTAYALINEVAKIIMRFPDENVIITGHTDNIGSELYQAKLSHQQAQLFAMLLWQNDSIDLKTFHRFKYAGMGDTRPITDNPSAYGQALNRRIQITIYPTQAMKEMYQLLAGSSVDKI